MAANSLIVHVLCNGGCPMNWKNKVSIFCNNWYGVLAVTLSLHLCHSHNEWGIVGFEE